MDCPNCGRAVPDSAAACPHCAFALEGAGAAAAPAPEGPDLVTVLETGDAALLAVAKSLLDAEGIECFAQGEGVQEFVGLGRMGLGSNLATGRVFLQVAPADAEAARALLAARGEFPEMPPGD
jgi:hypothetical protein